MIATTAVSGSNTIVITRYYGVFGPQVVGIKLSLFVTPLKNTSPKPFTFKKYILVHLPLENKRTFQLVECIQEKCSDQPQGEYKSAAAGAQQLSRRKPFCRKRGASTINVNA